MTDGKDKDNSPDVEPMTAFFDRRAGSYDEHMRQNVADFEAFYRAVARPVAPTGEPLRILDLGCGTGLELRYILARVPRAAITGIDLSAAMLARLRDRFAEHTPPPALHLIQGSYLELPLGEGLYDYAVSVMTLHHLLPEPKVALYRKIHQALRPGGHYIEGEWVVSPDDEAAYRQRYEQKARALGSDPAGHYHVDIPFSLATQQRLVTSV